MLARVNLDETDSSVIHEKKKNPIQIQLSAGSDMASHAALVPLELHKEEEEV